MLSFDTKFEPKIGKKGKEFIENSFIKLKKEKDSKSVGYYTLPNTTTALFKEIETYIKNNEDLQNNRIKNVAVVGIGGSSLGTKAIDAIGRVPDAAGNAKGGLGFTGISAVSAGL